MTHDFTLLADKIRTLGEALGFDAIAITDTDLSRYRAHLLAWLERGSEGEMGYMRRNIEKRLDPGALEPGTVRVITARMNYLPDGAQPIKVLADPKKAYIARYALGRDYHKVMRKRLAKLARLIRDEANGLGAYRAFTDSAPVLEKPLAEKSGIGTIGKNTLLLDRQAGSWFFLGEIFTDLPLPIGAKSGNKSGTPNAHKTGTPDAQGTSNDAQGTANDKSGTHTETEMPGTPNEDQTPGTPNEDLCGKCRACMTICPTGAITAERRLDASRCIAYLTIEHKTAIPVGLRAAIGNRIFGCDDCQLVCPWNRDAPKTREQDFQPRHGLDSADLLTLFMWDEPTFLARTRGMALRRVSFEQWQRNLAVALGNASPDPHIIRALRQRRPTASPLAKEHIDWALGEQLKGGSRPKFHSPIVKNLSR